MYVYICINICNYSYIYVYSYFFSPNTLFNFSFVRLVVLAPAYEFLVLRTQACQTDSFMECGRGLRFVNGVRPTTGQRQIASCGPHLL